YVTKHFGSYPEAQRREPGRGDARDAADTESRRPSAGRDAGDEPQARRPDRAGRSRRGQDADEPRTRPGARRRRAPGGDAEPTRRDGDSSARRDSNPNGDRDDADASRHPASRPARVLTKGPEYENLSVYFNLDNGTGKI